LQFFLVVSWFILSRMSTYSGIFYPFFSLATETCCSDT